MLADAIAAEAYKFLRQRSTLFWGFCAVPLGLLFYDGALETFVRAYSSGPITPGLMLMMAAINVKPDQQVIHALNLSSWSFIKIFFAMGAAGIFGNDYRWETWRLLTARNSRFNLMGAKFVVYALACSVSLAALAAVAALSAVYNAALNGMPLTFGTGSLRIIPGLFAASWAELMVLGGVVAVVAVAARTKTGALIAAIVFSFAQGIAMSGLPLWDASLHYFGLLPELCAEMWRDWLTGRPIAPGMTVDPDKLLPAAAFLAAWIALLMAAALGLFQRQDLPRE
jgi:ABC-2 type transport system permease protein